MKTSCCENKEHLKNRLRKCCGDSKTPLGALQNLREEIVNQTGYAPRFVLQQKVERFLPRLDVADREHDR